MIEIEARDVGASRIFSWRCLPVSVGRRGADFSLDRPGVWDHHLVLSRDSEGWIVATPHAEAAVFLEGKQLGPATRLRNGDRLDLGSARLIFRISDCCQRTLWALETVTWLGLIALVGFQIILLSLF